jgi:hypothetical protein
VGRLRFVPPGPWLLELYDQLYWTLDQMNLAQLTATVWALGRLRLVAVPSDLLERLLVFVALKLQQQQQQQQERSQQKQRETQGKAAAAGESAKASAAAAAAAAGGGGGGGDQGIAQRFTRAKQLSLLLSGLAGLSRQLSPGQQQQCGAWLMQVLGLNTPQAAQQVAGSLRSAARLQVRVMAVDTDAQEG